MSLFKRLRNKLQYLTKEEIEKIYQAYEFAFEAHKPQKRASGEPYITHPVAVACILADLHLDHQTLMAGLLHDVIEDTPVTKEIIIEKFTEPVAEIVDGVSKLTQIEFFSHAEAQAENLRKMVMAMSRDIRVILVKLADRLHNIRTLSALAEGKRRRIGKETLEIFAPIAKRLGMRDFSVEMEELSFAAWHPARYRILKSSISQARGHRKKILNLIEKELHRGFAQSDLPTCVITGREKHVYSIYRKMVNKHLSFNDIMDVYAFRIIVEDIDTCYRALGLVHQIFKPVPERFKDYIAIPKANGYQSLHTTLFGPYGLPIEVQIRTSDMDKMAMSGIAAHWLYKDAKSEPHSLQVRAEKWVQNLVELQKGSVNSLDFIENVKTDLFPDEVYVFTPKGKIMEMPGGSTAVDFAYTVHTEVGHACVAAKIDRQLAPLSTVLVNGQNVEIITAPSARPNPAWLDFVVTSKARSSIRHFLKNQKRSESVALGRQLFKQALLRHGYKLKKIDNLVKKKLLEETNCEVFDDLLEDIGLGNRIAVLVAQQLVSIMKHLGATVEQPPGQSLEDSLVVQGTEGMAVSFSSCCHPIPGDPIIGILKAGKGVEVHLASCSYIAKLRKRPGQGVSLRWSDKPIGEFIVRLYLEIENSRGVLADIAHAISSTEANIEDVEMKGHDGLHYKVYFDILVSGRAHLAGILKNLRQLKAVVRLQREY
mgnify:CR=1 FL=1